MFRGGWIVFRIIGTLLLIGSPVVEEEMLYRAGRDQGYTQDLAAARQGIACVIDLHREGYSSEG